MSEPVSQATLRIVKVFWGLSASLAYKRHFPAVDWIQSYSLYADKLKDWYAENISPDFSAYRAEAQKILQEEAALDEIVRLVGVDALSPRDRLTMEAAKSLREDYLHQNAFDDIDTYSPLEKQFRMQKIILDTNIVVSALIQKSYPHYIVFDYILDGQVKLCLSNALLNEYRDVLSRSKFTRINDFEKNAKIVLNRFVKTALFYEPKIYLDILKDKSDNTLLELAAESSANFLITGNSTDFTITRYKETQILSPRNFWELVI
jgi:putative PIN family toxin of toxin-antitoxin system